MCAYLFKHNSNTLVPYRKLISLNELNFNHFSFRFNFNDIDFGRKQLYNDYFTFVMVCACFRTNQQLVWLSYLSPFK